MKNSRLASWKTALPFLLPSLAGFVVFSIIPMIMQIFVSLTSWDGLSELTLFSDFSGFMDRFYVGIENYKEILTSKEFYQVIGNTLEFVILYIPLMLIASMIVALILNSHVKGVGIFRVLYYIPVITSWVAGALIWKWVLSPEYGAINNILALFGIEGPSWLSKLKVGNARNRSCLGLEGYGVLWPYADVWPSGNQSGILRCGGNRRCRKNQTVYKNYIAIADPYAFLCLDYQLD